MYAYFFCVDTCIESQKKDDSDNDSDDIDMLASAAKAWREHLSKETSPIKPLMSIKLTTEEPASELSHVMKSLENLKIKFEPTARMGDTSVSEPDFSNPCLTSSAVCDQSLCTTVESVKSEHFEPSERTSQSSATKSMKSPLTNILNGPNLRGEAKIPVTSVACIMLMMPLKLGVNSAVKILVSRIDLGTKVRAVSDQLTSVQFFTLICKHGRLSDLAIVC